MLQFLNRLKNCVNDETVFFYLMIKTTWVSNKKSFDEVKEDLDINQWYISLDLIQNENQPTHSGKCLH